MTQDCPVGRRERWIARFSWATAGALLLGLIASLGVAGSVSRRDLPPWVQKIAEWFRPRPTMGEPVLMGKPCPPPAPPAPPSPRSE